MPVDGGKTEDNNVMARTICNIQEVDQPQLLTKEEPTTSETTESWNHQNALKRAVGEKIF